MLSQDLIGRAYVPVSYAVDAETIRQYCRVLGDDNPHYTDREFARKSPYGTLVAPPTFSAVYTHSAVEALFSDPDFIPVLPRVVHGEQEFEFQAVVRAGDRITTRVVVESIYSKTGQNGIQHEFLILTTESKNQAGQGVSRGRTTLVIRGEKHHVS